MKRNQQDRVSVASTQTASFSKMHAARNACIAGLSLVLVLSGSLLPCAQAAYAASPSTQVELSALSSQVAQAAGDYEASTARVAEIEQEISAQAEEILRIEQEVLPEKRSRASEAAKSNYKSACGSSTLLSILVGSDSLGDLLLQVKYRAAVQEENVRAIRELEDAQAELEAKMEELSASREEAEAQQEAATSALANARSAQAKIQAKAQSEDAAEAAAAQKAAEEAAAITAGMADASSASNTGNSGVSSAGDSGASDSASDDSQAGSTDNGSPAVPDSSNSNASNNSAEGGSTVGSWKTGRASYYGIGDGFMGGTTASGAIVTETSMGVAMLNVPLGTYVEISCNGRSVIAVVNDRGPYVGGRVIDMQPAVARALGAIEAGVVTVQYRFL